MEYEMKKGMVSIIVPVFNTEKYLKRCIESIQNQTYVNIEIMLIDDGSTDASLTICNQYAKNDKRIKVIHQENQGVSIARNRGLDFASGEYIGFVDSDDYISNDMYEIMVREMERADVDMVACGYNFDIQNQIIPVKNKEEILENVMSAEQFMYYAYCRDSYKAVTNYTVLKLYSKKIIDKFHIEFDKRFKLGEDVVFTTQFYLNCKRVKYIERPLYYYYIRSDSAINDMNKDKQNILQAYEEVITLCETYRINQELLKYIKRFYVYWCGRCLEYSKGKKDEESILKIQKKANKYLAEYLETNIIYPERIEWIQSLLNHVTE